MKREWKMEAGRDPKNNSKNSYKNWIPISPIPPKNPKLQKTIQTFLIVFTTHEKFILQKYV